jgi:hypothetical protein
VHDWPGPFRPVPQSHGAHTLSILPVDAAGDVGTTFGYNWLVDANTPIVEMTEHPIGPRVGPGRAQSGPTAALEYRFVYRAAESSFSKYFECLERCDCAVVGFDVSSTLEWGECT